jgi:hypothetical protein
MSALPLYDLLLSIERSPGSPPADDVARLARWVAGSVEEALVELSHIRNIDEDLGTISNSTHFDRQAAALLQGAYEAWARKTESLLSRVAQIERRGRPVAQSDALRDEHGRVLAMLQVSLEDLDVAAEQARQGNVSTLGEVRGELLARNRG